MVTSLSVAVRIWAKSLSISMAFGTILALRSGEFGVVIFMLLALLFGFFITSPLLIIISPLVQWSSMLPYANRSKMTWLIFFLSVLHLLLLIAVCSIVQGNFNDMLSNELGLFYLSIIIVQFIAVRTTRKRLYTLYEQNTWPQD